MAQPEDSPTVTAATADSIVSRMPRDDAVFTPGTVVGGRYRIVALLGRGGMGEVYRADDLKLGQPVALKFLPRALAADPVRFERFLAEVRIARQVSHPNVCRVYDIADLERQPFLSMEYVDGEDLGSLLQRIGRLPTDKALNIARQICAGLAAAHDRGVLHRDLKPANVMLDGRGRVRITDFGLAVAADAPHDATGVSGTPPYMAPEQLAGRPASVQSDIYALGVMLYELYTGRRAFHAPSLSALLALKQEGLAPLPSEIIKDIDPAVERLIMRAAARDPTSRPASAAQMLALLPGGTALEAALLAGETPSPEIVAASGRRDGLAPHIAWALLALMVLGAGVAIARAPQWTLWQPQKSPEILAENARQLLASLGHTLQSADHASGFEVDLEQLRYLNQRDPVHWRSAKRSPAVLRFWHRESAHPLEAWRFPLQYGNVSRVTPSDPPPVSPGMTLVRLDADGRLTQLVVVPHATDESDGAKTEPDWTPFLTRAGFDPSLWKAAAPRRTPPVFADSRAAWEGVWPDDPHLAVRLEAAALRGRPVYFEAVYPWTGASRTPPILTTGERGAIVLLFLTVALTLVGVAVFAQRHVRAGRGDRRGAARVAAFVFAAMMVSWFIGESHVATLWEFALVAMALSWALFAAAFSWLAYLSVEPFIRRHWPEVLVSWTRLVAGDLRDPLVGRDILVGCVVAPLLVLVAAGTATFPERLGLPSDIVFVDVYGIAYSVRAVVPLLVWRAAQGVLAALFCMFLLVVLRLVFRREWIAIAAFVLASGAIGGVGSSHFGVGFVSTGVLTLPFALLLVRIGLLAAVTQFYVWGLFVFFPITTDLSAWYAGAGLTPLLVFAAIALVAFMTSLGSRPALGHAPQR